jgi:hypothetical protein
MMIEHDCGVVARGGHLSLCMSTRTSWETRWRRMPDRLGAPVVLRLSAGWARSAWLSAPRPSGAEPRAGTSKDGCRRSDGALPFALSIKVETFFNASRLDSCSSGLRIPLSLALHLD